MTSDTSREKRNHAVALQYEAGDKAPRVVASGAGEIAKRIIALAEEHDIPVRKDDSLVSILSKLDLGYEIPPETYRVVAQILAFLYRTDEVWRKTREAAMKPVAQKLATIEAQPTESQPTEPSAKPTSEEG